MSKIFPCKTVCFQPADSIQSAGFFRPKTENAKRILYKTAKRNVSENAAAKNKTNGSAGKADKTAAGQTNRREFC
ncbi:MAG TPA: hypothetical protein DCE08_06950 [Ruminococcaceae bacterium]|nr:hypothetical protein [Oscillospiraceae bacterium]